MKVQILFLLVGLVGLTASIGAIADARGRASEKVHVAYFANGQVESQCAYEDGRREGAFQRFASDGRLLAEGRYAADRMEGRWSFWRADGSLDPQRSGLYRAGERVGD